MSGSIYYGGEDISGKTVAMLAGEVGYVFQNPDDQIFKYHVMDEVMFGPLNIGMSREEAAEYIDLLSGYHRQGFLAVFGTVGQ